MGQNCGRGGRFPGLACSQGPRRNGQVARLVHGRPGMRARMVSVYLSRCIRADLAANERRKHRQAQLGFVPLSYTDDFSTLK